MTQSVNHQVRRAIMVELYTHASFSLPCLALLAISWSLLFHDYLPAGEALGWLGLVFLCCWGADGTFAGVSPGWRSSRCQCWNESCLSG